MKTKKQPTQHKKNINLEDVKESLDNFIQKSKSKKKIQIIKKDKKGKIIKDNHSPFNQTKYIIDNIHKTMKNIIYKDNININQQMSIKDIILSKNKFYEKKFPIISHSQIAKKKF